MGQAHTVGTYAGQAHTRMHAHTLTHMQARAQTYMQAHSGRIHQASAHWMSELNWLESGAQT